jgi:hypothetical protein
MEGASKTLMVGFEKDQLRVIANRHGRVTLDQMRLGIKLYQNCMLD